MKHIFVLILVIAPIFVKAGSGKEPVVNYLERAPDKEMLKRDLHPQALHGTFATSGHTPSVRSVTPDPVSCSERCFRSCCVFPVLSCLGAFVAYKKCCFKES